MFTLVDIPTSDTSKADTTSLIADYLTFDRQRTSRRQYMKAFGGMALVIMFGALFHYVPRREALAVDALLMAPPTVLAGIEAISWHRLNQRLSRLRTETQTIKKS